MKLPRDTYHRTRPILNPKTNEWDKGKKFRPVDPDGADVLPEDGAGPEVRRVLRCQGTDGLWDWDGLPAPTAVFPEFRRWDLVRAGRRLSDHDSAQWNDERLAATVCVIAVLTRAYARQSAFFSDAMDKALAALGRRTGKAASHVHELAAAMCQQLTEKWKQEHAEFARERRAKQSGVIHERLNAARQLGMPIQKCHGEHYVRNADGDWVRAVDEEPAPTDLVVQIEALWRNRFGGSR
jgi:hypothetical protein